MDEIGKPLFWELSEHIAAVVGMIRADELQLALEMCDQVPSFYRSPETYPKELSEIKRKLFEQTYDQIEYATDDDEANCTREFGEAQWDNGYMYPRAQIISEIVKQECENGERPWILDVGCSHGNLPLGLLKSGHKFHYRGLAMNKRILDKVRGWVSDVWRDKPAPGQTAILFCSEVLEHASRLEDVVHSAYKVGVEFDIVVLSVPLNTLGGGLPDWDTRRLGHVRCFNEQELTRFADKHWPGLEWMLYLGDSMVIVGKKTN